MSQAPSAAGEWFAAACTGKAGWQAKKSRRSQAAGQPKLACTALSPVWRTSLMLWLSAEGKGAAWLALSTAMLKASTP